MTGGAGFIGSNFCRMARNNGYRVVTLDALTYAGHRANLKDLETDADFRLVVGNICDAVLLEKLFAEENFQGVIHFAAESHVDNSIHGPRVFIETNVLGTFTLLEAARQFVKAGAERIKANPFRFVHVSTDEVFGSLGETGYFSESSPYAPNSPYSASKAGSDMLARAWHHTYGLDTIVTNCSNNYGPRQFPEKLIPVIINSALNEKSLPVYGKGENVRDWIHVEDHCQGVMLAFTRGKTGSTYLFGGHNEVKNIDLVRTLCHILDKKCPRGSGKKYDELIKFVTDRPGHDYRYAIDDSYAQRELGFERRYSHLAVGLEQTVDWYLANTRWMEDVKGRRD